MITTLLVDGRIVGGSTNAIEARDAARDLSRMLNGSVELRSSRGDFLGTYTRGEFILPPPRSVMTLAEAEEWAIRNAMEFAGWNTFRAAKCLQTSRTTLYRKLKELKISRTEGRSEVDPTSLPNKPEFSALTASA